MQTSIIYLLAFFLTVLVVTSERPEFPTTELCELYKEKCESKLKKNNCKERRDECLQYTTNGLKVTWNFCELILSSSVMFSLQCMFLNNDNEKACRERAIIDYEVIKTAVMNDTFKYDFLK
ncbi:hypothetical protein OESDEN_15547 [Oesophagostomum dentatum]|uniref:Uncharacterized protein n=1 Tax=Oesophagostomum dentatum TaxID=61180 RepID=A0A0B1SNH8_OESDE|nr:hypothetical protein OESDEN_15547 [Oesophagostomum dentatum]